VILSGTSLGHRTGILSPYIPAELETSVHGPAVLSAASSAPSKLAHQPAPAGWQVRMTHHGLKLAVKHSSGHGPISPFQPYPVYIPAIWLLPASLLLFYVYHCHIPHKGFSLHPLYHIYEFFVEMLNLLVSRHQDTFHPPSNGLSMINVY
jgi:hypothetical protein